MLSSIDGSAYSMCIVIASSIVYCGTYSGSFNQILDRFCDSAFVVFLGATGFGVLKNKVQSSPFIIHLEITTP